MKKFLLIIFACIVALALGEVAIRYLLPVSTVRYVYDTEIGTHLAPNSGMWWTNRYDFDVQVVTNSEGFHDHERAVPKPSNVYRIVVLGDSFMEALQVPIPENFASILQERLQHATDGMEIVTINLGLSGRGPAQYYRILEKKGLRYDPDLVLMSVFPGNDFRDSHPDLNSAPYKTFYQVDGANKLERLPYFVPAWYSTRALLQHSALAYFLVFEILKRPLLSKLANGLGLIPRTNPPANLGIKQHGRYLPPSQGVYLTKPNPVWADAYEITLRMIRETRDLAASRGVGFVALVLPDLSEVSGLRNSGTKNVGDFELDYRRPYKMIQAYCDENGIPILDLTSSFKRDFIKHKMSHSWDHDGHWNARGHEIAATTVAEFLIESILPPQ